MAKKNTAETVTSETTAPEKAKAAFEQVKKIASKLFKEAKIGDTIRLSGIVTDAKVEEEKGQYGIYTKFKGEFYAKCGDMIYGANIAYLPGVAEALVANAFAQGKGNPVEFRFDLLKKVNAASPVGYEWAVRPIGELTTSGNKLLLALND